MALPSFLFSEGTFTSSSHVECFRSSSIPETEMGPICPSSAIYFLLSDVRNESDFLWAESEADLRISLVLLSQLPDKQAYFSHSFSSKNDWMFLPQV
jgi:hypothetical protein